MATTKNKVNESNVYGLKIDDYRGGNTEFPDRKVTLRRNLLKVIQRSPKKAKDLYKLISKYETIQP